MFKNNQGPDRGIQPIKSKNESCPDRVPTFLPQLNYHYRSLNRLLTWTRTGVLLIYL